MHTTLCTPKILEFYMHDLAPGVLLGIDALRRQVSPAADVLGTA